MGFKFAEPLQRTKHCFEYSKYELKRDLPSRKVFEEKWNNPRLLELWIPGGGKSDGCFLDTLCSKTAFSLELPRAGNYL